MLLKPARLSWACGLLSTGLMLLAGWLWLYNTWYAWEVISTLLSGDTGTLRALLRDPWPGPLPATWGLGVPLLNWLATVDQSTVTTGVCVVFFGYVAVGSFRLRTSLTTQQPHPTLLTVHFPFPSTYKTYFVQFGLLGTLLAFILAFSAQRLLSDIKDPEMLYRALGTALWSSFTAIFLAYGVCPLVEYGFAYTIRHAFRFDEPDEGLARIALGLQRLANHADLAQTSLQTFTAHLQDFEHSLLGPALTRQLAAQDNRLRALEEQIQRLPGEVERRMNDTFTQIHTDIRSYIGACDRMSGEISALTQRMHTLSDALAGQESRIQTLEAHLTDLRSRLRKAVQ